VGHTLLDILITPSQLPELCPSEQTRIIRQARHTGLLGFLEARIDADTVNGKLGDHLLSAKVHADYSDREISWEINRLELVLAQMKGPIILLKGAAYKALDLGLAQGRLASDVDLLIPRDQLQEAEDLLLNAGWKAMNEDDYEQHYYREWMHELPPLKHEERGTIVDLHHTILPLTARLKPDPQKLIAGAISMPSSPFYTLTPEDTVLHRAAHLFYDGDLYNSIRELVDLHELISAYSTQQSFADCLAVRARELDLVKPLYYALYFCRRLLHTKIPEQVVSRLGKEATPAPLRQFVCYLMEQQLLSVDPDQHSWLTKSSGWLLFLRSHWLKMPPLMLLRHILIQIWRRGGIKTG